ncbi:MAG: Tissue inhibitor of metalloproteinase [Thermoanaerobaculia bacterium]|nr:Tissue inhibitor of metalloproteinase [Thermoanaerobaculia bacterium]
MRRILLTAILLFVCRPSFACSCVVTGANPADGWVKQADVVFVGRVTAIVPEPRPIFQPGQIYTPLNWGPGNGVRVSFDITSAIKGTRDRVISLWTGYGGGDCGIDFHAGLTYIVLAHYDAHGTLIAAICSGTGWLGYRYAREQFAWLLQDVKWSDAEPYDVIGGIAPPILIGARVPELAPTDNFSVLLEIDREGRVTHFSFESGKEICTVCCAEKRNALLRNVPLWRFQPATIDGNPVAVRIRQLTRWNVRTTSEDYRREQDRFEFERRRFEQKVKP